jgi:hypothetical protein
VDKSEKLAAVSLIYVAVRRNSREQQRGRKGLPNNDHII